MTTQRDRLAVIVGEAALAEMERQGASENFTWSNVADALLARGVRIVDVDTLERAMRLVMGNAIGLVPAAATDILAALDGEAAS